MNKTEKVCTIRELMILLVEMDRKIEKQIKIK